jgi:hypothetical protein
MSVLSNLCLDSHVPRIVGMLPDFSLLNSPPPAPDDIFAWRDIATDTRGRFPPGTTLTTRRFEVREVDGRGFEAGVMLESGLYRGGKSTRKEEVVVRLRRQSGLKARKGERWRNDISIEFEACCSCPRCRYILPRARCGGIMVKVHHGLPSAQGLL